MDRDQAQANQGGRYPAPVQEPGGGEPIEAQEDHDMEDSDHVQGQEDQGPYHDQPGQTPNLGQDRRPQNKGQGRDHVGGDHEVEPVVPEERQQNQGHPGPPRTEQDDRQKGRPGGHENEPGHPDGRIGCLPGESQSVQPHQNGGVEGVVDQDGLAEDLVLDERIGVRFPVLGLGHKICQGRAVLGKALLHLDRFSDIGKGVVRLGRYFLVPQGVDGDIALGQEKEGQAQDNFSAEVQNQKEVKAKENNRLFRSKKTLPRRILGTPKYIWFPLKYSAKKALIFSERVDLMNRVIDFFYFNDEKTAGWFPKFSVGGKTSVAIGASIFYDDMFNQSRRWRFSFTYGDEDEWTIKGIAEAPEFLGPQWRPALKLWAEEKGTEDYFFNELRQRSGNNTRKTDRTVYDTDRIRLRFDLPYLAFDSLTIGINLDLDFGDVEEGLGSDLPIPGQIEGAYGEAIFYAGGDLYLIFDTRDSDYRATRGWLLEGRSGSRTNFEGTDGLGRDLSFYSYDLQVQRFVKLFSVFRSIVVRARLAGTAPLEGSDGVPFYFQPVLDEDQALRGYKRGRFRDRGALLFNVEYRYPIWDTWDGAIFLDEGQVFRHLEQFTWDRFHWSAGAGIRFSGKNGFLFRVQAAFSDEAHPQMIMKMEQVF